jgi:hypothetical protein
MANVCNTLKLSVYCNLQVEDFPSLLGGLHLQIRKAIFILSEDEDRASHVTRNLRLSLLKIQVL